MLLAHDDHGTGQPVVLLHAGIADRRMWEREIARLSTAGHRAIAVDLPGFGESPPARERDAPWLDVLETLDALGAERFALAGNSFGGAVAIRVAALAPDRVAGLVLVSAPDDEIDSSPRLRAAWEAEEEALERGDIEAATASVVDAWTLPGAPPELRERIAEMQRNAFELQLAAPDAEEGEDPLAPGAAGAAGMIGRFPIVVAVGEHDMPDFQAAAARIADLLAAPPAITIPGAGHLAPLEQPEAFHELLTGFLSGPGTNVPQGLP